VQFLQILVKDLTVLEKLTCPEPESRLMIEKKMFYITCLLAKVKSKNSTICLSVFISQRSFGSDQRGV
jgi:hypothetical protein